MLPTTGVDTGTSFQLPKSPITKPTMALSTTFDWLELKPVPTRFMISYRCSDAMPTKSGNIPAKQAVMFGGLTLS